MLTWLFIVANGSYVLFQTRKGHLFQLLRCSISKASFSLDTEGRKEPSHKAARCPSDLGLLQKYLQHALIFLYPLSQCPPEGDYVQNMLWVYIAKCRNVLWYYEWIDRVWFTLVSKQWFMSRVVESMYSRTKWRINVNVTSFSHRYSGLKHGEHSQVEGHNQWKNTKYQPLESINLEHLNCCIMEDQSHKTIKCVQVIHRSGITLCTTERWRE